jgi:hypothetical protein
LDHAHGPIKNLEIFYSAKMEETVDKAVVDVEKSENSERPEESQFYSIILAFFNILDDILSVW